MKNSDYCPICAIELTDEEKDLIEKGKAEACSDCEKFNRFDPENPKI